MANAVNTTLAQVPMTPFCTVFPNRIFVGGLSSDTTEAELYHTFAQYGNVLFTKIITDRTGVSKGYGFITFETNDEAQKLLTGQNEPFILRERRLNIAPAVKKTVMMPSFYPTFQPAPTPVFQPVTEMPQAGGACPGPYQQVYPYYMPVQAQAQQQPPPQPQVAMWSQNYQANKPQNFQTMNPVARKPANKRFKVSSPTF